MIEQYKVNGFSFDNKEAYDCAVKEEQVVRTMRSKFKSSDTKMAYKVYVKAVQEHVFTTVVGYEFLMELRQAILASGSISEKKLPAIPVQGSSAAMRRLLWEIRAPGRIVQDVTSGCTRGSV